MLEFKKIPIFADAFGEKLDDPDFIEELESIIHDPDEIWNEYGIYFLNKSEVYRACEIVEMT